MISGPFGVKAAVEAGPAECVRVETCPGDELVELPVAVLGRGEWYRQNAPTPMSTHPCAKGKWWKSAQIVAMLCLAARSRTAASSAGEWSSAMSLPGVTWSARATVVVPASADESLLPSGCGPRSAKEVRHRVVDERLE